LTAVLLLVFALLGVLAYGFRTDPRAIPSPLVRAPAPDFQLTLFDGSFVRLSDYRGKAVVLNFWASWCIPCREEAPLLEAAWRALKDRDVVFLGVNIQDSEEAATAFIREFGLSFPNGRDAAAKIAIDYGVYGIPETFFIDRQGRITAKVIGPLGPETLVARARDALQGIASAEERRPGYQSVR
jgi:cytochrome c biogenesis protein CcmG/thiol:disulfide interchange protein DsbE